MAEDGPIRPILVALPEIPPRPREVWPAYRRRVELALAPVRRQASQIAGLQLEPLFAANALLGQAAEGAVKAIRHGELGDEVDLVEWGEDLPGAQMDGGGRGSNRVGRMTGPSALSGRGVTVAVLDSGIDASHPYLAVAASVSACPEPEGVPGRHGTLCAGVIASRRPERPGIASGVRLLDVKVARASGWIHPGWLARGVDLALDLGADILSISFGFNVLPVTLRNGHGWVCREGRCLLCRAVDHCFACGSLVVAAVGNEHLRAQAFVQRGGTLPPDGEILCPARARGALAVGAFDREPLRRPYPSSSRGGGKPDLMAAGAEITSTLPVPRNRSRPHPDDLVGTASGTSMAAAVVAGAAALLLEREKAAGRFGSPADIRRQLLTEHIRPIDLTRGNSDAVGAGVLDLTSLPRRFSSSPHPLSGQGGPNAENRF